MDDDTDDDDLNGDGEGDDDDGTDSVIELRLDDADLIDNSTFNHFEPFPSRSWPSYHILSKQPQQKKS